MAVVIAVALQAATAVLGPASSGALRTGQEELVTVPAPATSDPEIPQSPGTLGYDGSSARGGMRGLALLSGNSN